MRPRHAHRRSDHAPAMALALIGLGVLACGLVAPVVPEAPETAPPAAAWSSEPTVEEPSSQNGEASSPAADAWGLWTNGTQLRGANIWQRVVVPELDGTEFLGTGYIGPPFTQEDFDRLAALGANLVDLSHPGLYTERAPFVLDEQAQANLDHLIDMATRADLFVVITYRTGPGRSDFTFYRDGAGDWFDRELLIESVWTDREAQDAWVDMWRYTAGRYRDNPNVVGYDLMCEPNSNDVVLDVYGPEEFYPEHAGSLADWNQLYPRIVAGVREEDPDTPILVSAMGWGSVRWLPALVPTDDPRTVYTVHQYEPQETYTHQVTPAANSYPGEFDIDGDEIPDLFDLAWLDGYLAAVDDFKSQHGVPVSVNEFGVQRWAPKAADFMADQMDLFEQRGMNHALWAWDPDWEPWTASENAMNYLFGPDPGNITSVDNELLRVITEAWARNTARPSNLLAHSPGGPEPTGRRERLAQVSRWLYLIGADLAAEGTGRVAASSYDMVVLDFTASQAGEEDYPQAAVLDELHRAGKLVLAYIDVGQAEDYRTYWQNGWRIGEPDWILGGDPDGWEGNFPVAYWIDEWQAIWLANGGLLEKLVEAGFDGVYLDWIEAYSDENVVAAAERDGLDPVEEMIRWVEVIAATVRGKCPACVVVAQNAAELLEREDYVAIIDGIAQEQVWFDGGADNDPQGDCPLPRAEADVDSPSYYQSLSHDCRRQYENFPESTLHVSSEAYLYYLRLALDQGLPVFTVDYALEPENVQWVYREARGLGFIPFVSNRGLDQYIEPVP